MKTIHHKFVEYMPEVLERDVLYISMENAVAVHRCFCGCGVEVNTPLSRKGWILTFDGDSVTLSPSIGSRALNCQSHYIIERNKVHFIGWELNKKEESPSIERKTRFLLFGSLIKWKKKKKKKP